MKTLKLKYKNTYIENIKPLETLYEISKQVEKDYQYEIVGAKLNQYLTGLNTQLTANGEIEFYDLSSNIGNKIYSRSLEFLVTVAKKKKLGPKADILINYSLENGIYCEVINETVTKQTIKQIEEKMREIISKKMQFKE